MPPLVRPSALLRTLAPYLPLALATAALALATTRAVLEKAGGPAVPLDDSYIHFQYARSIAELHPFRYTPGAEPTPGATSLLWPLLLAPFHAAGFRGELLVWVAWAFGWTSLALLALETRRLAEGLVTRDVALAAGAMVLAFGGFAWFAASGMEVVPFAWLLTRTVRRASEWVERGESDLGAPEADRSRAEHTLHRELLALSVLCPLMRPEGVLGSLLVLAALVFRAPRGGRWRALPALAGPFLPVLVGLVATGQAITSTALAKWLPFNPYYRGARLPAAVAGNVELFFGTLLDGRLWTSVFLPSGGRLLGVLALLALAVAGIRRRRVPRAVAALAMALAILVPTTYETFLVNRVRYVWPFAPAWFIGLAAVAELAGEGAERLFARAGARTSRLPLLLAGILVGLLGARLSPSIDDLAESARAVSLQQVSLARWANRSLPATARIGVNDTGAIAYFGGRTTFDVVGLTTAGEARYWTAGPGSRFEHFERLPPGGLPTHFIVYPEWFAIDALLGEELTSRSVRHTILGGELMAAHVARYDLLRTGERPDDATLDARRLLDALDVADLESEAAHHYRLFDATREQNHVVRQLDEVDGARGGRRRDRFELRLSRGGVLVARWGATEAARVRVRVGDRVLAERSVPAEAWRDAMIRLPDDPATRGDPHEGGALVDVEATAGAFESLHYWSYE